MEHVVNLNKAQSSASSIWRIPIQPHVGSVGGERPSGIPALDTAAVQDKSVATTHSLVMRDFQLR